MTDRILQGDALEQLRTLADESVQCVVTSPPYYGLRDYGTAEWDGGEDGCDHVGEPFRTKSKLNENWGAGFADVKNAEGRQPFLANCGKCGATRVDDQIGLESSPTDYIGKLVDVFREVRRVLRKDGVAWVNMGDSYATGTNGDRKPTQTGKHGYWENPNVNKRTHDAALKPKDLMGMPWRLAFALQQPYYTGQIKDERDRIWLAAIIDGEGCFFIHRRKAGTPSYSKFARADGSEANYTRTADTFGVGLEISNTNKAIIDRVQALIPSGTITTQGPEQNGRRKQIIYRWRVSPNETKRIAQELYPHLVGKQHQARLVFNCQSTGDAGTAAHAAMMDLHNGVGTALDYPPPPSLFEPGWYLRQDVIWGKPNPMPESVTDRCTKAHEYVFLLSNSERYYYDAEAIAEPALAQSVEWNKYEHARKDGATYAEHGSQKGGARIQSADTRNKRSVWTITSEPYPDAHFATFPTELPRICILAGSRVGDTILDPFNGSGTTGQVALELARAYIGIELNPEYVTLTNKRLSGVTLGLPLEIAA